MRKDPPPPFAELCSWFPSLRNCSTPAQLKNLLKSPAVTSGSEAAARFCLDVWNGSGKFRLVEIAGWDINHRAAFERWARDPFFY